MKIQTLLPLLKGYSWLLLPIVLFIFLLIFLVSLFMQPASTNIPLPTSNITPIPTSAFINIPLTPNPSDESVESEPTENLEELPGFEKKVQRTDGITIYFYTSEKPDRPNITIVNSNDVTIFYRNLSTKDQPLITIPIIKETFGDPDKIIQGSTYFGQQAQIYVYEESKLVFIVNPQTNETYEEQGFPAMSMDEYLTKFANQN